VQLNNPNPPFKDYHNAHHRSLSQKTEKEKKSEEKSKSRKILNIRSTQSDYKKAFRRL